MKLIKISNKNLHSLSQIKHKSNFIRNNISSAEYRPFFLTIKKIDPLFLKFLHTIHFYEDGIVFHYADNFKIHLNKRAKEALLDLAITNEKN